MSQDVSEQAEASLTFLHLSDIHFHRYSNKPGDSDRDIRVSLIDDVDRMCTENGYSIKALLITGDIAFAGKANEYTQARAWLDDLTARLSVPSTHIWVVPGNHDVDLDTIKQRPSVRDARTKIKTAPLENLEDRLNSYVRVDEERDILLSPLSNYLNLAGQLECQPGPELTWKKQFPLGDVNLEVTGINSVLLSDDDDAIATLIVGLTQCQLGTQDSEARGLVQIAMFHHPLEWWKVHANNTSTLTARTRVLLFGHVHEHRVEQQGNTLLICANAVNPHHADRKSIPGYNIVRMKLASKDGHRKLVVETLSREWIAELARFGQAGDPDSRTTRTHTLDLMDPIKRRDLPKPVIAGATLEAIATVVVEATVQQAGHGVPEEAAVNVEDQSVAFTPVDDFWRQALRSFYDLSPDRRLQALSAASADMPESEPLPERERIRRTLAWVKVNLGPTEFLKHINSVAALK